MSKHSIYERARLSVVADRAYELLQASESMLAQDLAIDLRACPSDIFTALWLDKRFVCSIDQTGKRDITWSLCPRSIEAMTVRVREYQIVQARERTA